MTIKANAHFVDCDGATGDGGDWESTRSGAATVANDYKITYISQNGAIWGIPIDFENYTTLTLDAGDARHISGTGSSAVIGLPCVGHPFVEGQVIWLEGTSNYEQKHTLTSGTTANELVFEDYFNAETFDGTETVVQYIYLGVVLGSSQGRMDYDEDGNMYFGYSTGVAKISFDGITIDDSFFSPGDAFSGACLGVKVTSDSSYIYICFDDHKLYKFDLSDGSEEWQVSTGTVDNYDIDVDADDNVYVCNASAKKLSAFSTFYRLRKFAAADGSITTFDYLPSTYSVVVDDDIGRVICGSRHSWREVDTEYYQGNLFSTDLDGANQISTQLGTPIPVGVFGLFYGPIIPTGCIVTYDDYIYVLCDGEVYKLDSDLNIKAQIATGDLPDYPVGLFVDIRGHIVVVNQRWAAPHQSDIFYFYDTDLNFITNPDHDYYDSMLITWAASVGGAYSQGNIAFMYENPPYGSPTTIGTWSLTQDRTVTYPIGYGHLEGETVQVLGDGIYLGTETVVDGNIALDDNTTVNHVGLQYTSTLQPMKIDGESNVKRIRHLIPDVFESVGGDYGEDIDDLYTMSLRDTNDPMDIDGDLYTGYLELPFKGSYNRQGDIWITQDEPLPMNLLALGVKMSVERK